MEQISILGCGWLGLPLAKEFLAKGYSIKGSTTSPEKVNTLQQAGIKPYRIALHPDTIEGDITDFLTGSKTLIIDIPPKLRGKGEKENFTDKIKTLLPHIEKSDINKVLFISSTSVYGDVEGIITEETTPQPNSESGKQLLEVEQLLQNNKNFKTVIIRFGGLIGEDRHPVHYLAGKKDIPNPNAPVNLIHQDDCISIILNSIEKNFEEGILNGVAPYHPTKKEYYTKKAKEKNLPLPIFTSREEACVVKKIAVNKVTEVFNYTFNQNNL